MNTTTLSISEFFEITLPELFTKHKEVLADNLPNNLALGFISISEEETERWFIIYADEQLHVDSEAPETVHLAIAFNANGWEQVRPRIEAAIAQLNTQQLQQPQNPGFTEEKLNLLLENPGVLSVVIKNVYGEGKNVNIQIIIGSGTTAGLTELKITIDRNAIDMIKSGKVGIPQAFAMGLLQIQGDMAYAMKLAGLAMSSGVNLGMP